MKSVITVQQRKGGGTKTTTAADLVLHLARAGHRVLAVDMDSARALSQRLGWLAYDVPERTTIDFLDGEPLEACVTACELIEGVDVLQAGPGLDAVSDQSVTALRDVLPTLDQYDVAVIDTPGDYGRGTAAAVAAADTIVVPVPAEGEAVLVLDDMEDFRDGVQRRLRRGKSAQTVWYVPTKIVAQQKLARDLLTVLHERYDAQVTEPVRAAVAAQHAFVERRPVGLHVTGEDTVAGDYARALAPIVAAVAAV